MSMNQWFSKLLVSKRIGLKCFFEKNAIFFQYFTVVEQFVLQFVKYRGHSIGSLLQISL